MHKICGQDIQNKISHAALESNRSVCDILFCDFMAKSYKTKYRTPALESNRSVCDIVLCDFLAKSYKSTVARRGPEPEIPDLKMRIRARNAVLMLKL